MIAEETVLGMLEDHCQCLPVEVKQKRRRGITQTAQLWSLFLWSMLALASSQTRQVDYQNMHGIFFPQTGQFWPGSTGEVDGAGHGRNDLVMQGAIGALQSKKISQESKTKAAR